ncbi:MAG: hormogonium polysaccharide secretion pseudopilin HpsC [Limnoraphis sp.]
MNRLPPNTGSSKFKHSQSVSGFTMIELLVGAILAVLIISPLMGFVVSILEDNKREEAKVASDQEVQAALNFIKEDLSQAVHIYDRTGVAALNDANGIQKINKTPILVFWKRKLVPDILPVNGTDCTAGCNDTFVYSLVTYYVTEEANATWSNQARIERVEISGAVSNPSVPANPYQPADPGYADFDPKDWNAWTKDQNQNLPPTDVLIDYIDASVDINPAPADADCQRILARSTGSSNAQLISDQSLNGANGGSSYGFYACVDTEKNIAQVNIRGNGLARIQPNNATYDPQKKANFPTGSVVVRGLSGFGE